MSLPVQTLPAAAILARASVALGKVDLWGMRGVTMLSLDETEALALLAAWCGLVPTKPGETPPPAYFLTPSKEL